MSGLAESQAMSGAQARVQGKMFDAKMGVLSARAQSRARKGGKGGDDLISNAATAVKKGATAAANAVVSGVKAAATTVKNAIVGKPGTAGGQAGAGSIKQPIQGRHTFQDVDLTDKGKDNACGDNDAQKGGAAKRKNHGGDETADALPSAAQAITFVSKSDTPLKAQYDLNCVVRHLGRAAFAGHYNTDVRGRASVTRIKGNKETVFKTKSRTEDDEDALWSRFDDSSVQAGLSQASVLQGDKNQRSAYLLFYVLRSD